MYLFTGNKINEQDNNEPNINISGLTTTTQRDGNGVAIHDILCEKDEVCKIQCPTRHPSFPRHPIRPKITITNDWNSASTCSHPTGPNGRTDVSKAGIWAQDQCDDEQLQTATDRSYNRCKLHIDQGLASTDPNPEKRLTPCNGDATVGYGEPFKLKLRWTCCDQNRARECCVYWNQHTSTCYK